MDATFPTTFDHSCSFMVFKPQPKKNQLFEFHDSINKQSIPHVSEAMFLGVFVTDNLSWKSHISLS